MSKQQRVLLKDTLEKFENLINYLKEMNKTIPIIVEGDRDKKALRDMGFEGIIIKLNEGKDLVSFSDDISKKYSKVILFLDWDKKGNALTERLKNLLEEDGVICDTIIRKKLINLLGSRISTVEELPYVTS